MAQARTNRSLSDPRTSPGNQSQWTDISQIAYSKNQYKRDIVLIFALDNKMAKGGFLHLDGILILEDTLSACIVVQLFDIDKKRQLLEAGLSDLYTAIISARTVESFSRFINRFCKGPTNINDNAEES
jgi:hypothetical protein